MKSTLMQTTPAIGLPASVVTAQLSRVRHTGPDAAAQGTAVSFAGLTLVETLVPAAAQAAVAGVRSTDLPGSPPRGAPV